VAREGRVLRASSRPASAWRATQRPPRCRDARHADDGDASWHSEQHRHQVKMLDRALTDAGCTICGARRPTCRPSSSRHATISATWVR
jgi:hypothetical protein